MAYGTLSLDVCLSRERWSIHQLPALLSLLYYNLEIEYLEYRLPGVGRPAAFLPALGKRFYILGFFLSGLEERSNQVLQAVVRSDKWRNLP